MENSKASALSSIKDANNVLVTVSSNPSVDQLAAAIGFTLLLNKLGKHAAAVFSGDIPSTIEFLQPEATLEKTTDSLRDFIIALDKSKADKLRYKVEDKMVKIFITPFRTSISQEDLDFSQGDFNIDVVLAVGVHEQKDLDTAITAHGRILHDATIVSINNHTAGSLGSINWVDEQASSLCEMLASLGPELKEDIFDPQMSTALLTGIVAETDRFSNHKTTPTTMSISAKLMAAGANQQLVATKLKGDYTATTPTRDNKPADTSDNKDDGNDDGSLSISHNVPDDNGDGPGGKLDQPQYDSGHFDTKDEPQDMPEVDDKPVTSALPANPKFVLDPPTLGGTLTASTQSVDNDPSTDPLTLPPVSPPLLESTPSVDEVPESDDASALQSLGSPSQDNSDSKTSAPAVSEPLVQSPPADEPSELNSLDDETPAEPLSATPTPALTKDTTSATPPPAPAEEPEEDSTTLASLEKAVDSPHLAATTDDGLNAARDAVSQAVASGLPPTLEPITALNAQPIDLNSQPEEKPPEVTVIKSQSPAQSGDGYLDITKIDENTGLPSTLVHSDNSLPSDSTAGSVENPTAPPPVPPPMMPMAPPEPQDMQHGQQALPNAENDNDAQDPLAPL